jgi:hypothetical protein
MALIGLALISIGISLSIVISLMLISYKLFRVKEENKMNIKLIDLLSLYNFRYCWNDSDNEIVWDTQIVRIYVGDELSIDKNKKWFEFGLNSIVSFYGDDEEELIFKDFIREDLLQKIVSHIRVENNILHIHLKDKE